MSRQNGYVCGSWRAGRVTWITSMCVMLLLAGCDQKKSGESTPGEPEATPSTASGSPDVDEATPPETAGDGAGEEATKQGAASQGEEDRTDATLSASARSLVKDWQRAQNEGDFKAYGELYAGRMTGVKRVGPRKFVYDRAGWLDDRERMFKKKIDVTLADIEVVPSGRTAVVTMTQTWASGTYKDTGPKRLVLLMNEEGELKISREEMIESRVLQATERVPPLEVGEMGFAVHQKSPEWMVFPIALGVDKVKRDRAISIERGRSAALEIEPASMTQGWKELVGKSMKLVTPKGGSCEAKIKRVVGIASAIPHFGQENVWNGEPGTEDAKRLSDDRVAVELAEIASDEGLYLGVELDGAGDASCQGWSWGELGTSGVPHASFQEVKDGPLKKEITEMFQALPGFALIQKDYPEQGRKWANGDEIEISRARLGDREFVYVGASVGTMCDRFVGELWAIYEVGSDYVLMTDGENPGDFKRVTEALDLGEKEGVAFLGKGTFYDDRAMIQSTGAVWRTTHWWRIPYYDCPC